ncbi:MAG TPA: L,D-transpeptidase [Stackebrandtia sp.]|jgi:peptidoglycan hydrolase-like protein with peptidoglycan-binding domain|uniref:L,D-transpeptidase family protein n=1 Tax=Stackebrandtia sp. TaxID=2023065 RepID=UPI002D5AB627|nr:L,D-transpeptidase [Stackebrandtia sp.]HZE40027.1 L,D-transpeptidase [Stackebrandtia sp.]
MGVRKAILVISAVAAVVAGSTMWAFNAYANDDRGSAHDTHDGTKDDASKEPEFTGCETGPYQEQVEQALNGLGGFGTLNVDGRQSRNDCDAIKDFQKRFGVKSAEGTADKLTDTLARHLVGSDMDKCGGGSGRVVCVDLTHQTLWVTKNGKTVFGPTVVRTGKKGLTTATGHFFINSRGEKHWSTIYHEWLPYWQHFYNGMGLHETTTYLHDPNGSHGCVNLLHDDAKKLYGMLRMNDAVHVFGHRSGT